MATIYADLIMKGRKTIEDVPGRIREDVKQILIDRGRGDLAESER